MDGDPPQGKACFLLARDLLLPSPTLPLAPLRRWGQPKWQPEALGRSQEDKLQREIPVKLGIWQWGLEYPDLNFRALRNDLAEAQTLVNVDAWHGHLFFLSHCWFLFSSLLSSNWRPCFVSICFPWQTRVYKGTCALLNQPKDVTRLWQWVTEWEWPLTVPAIYT